MNRRQSFRRQPWLLALLWLLCTPLSLAQPPDPEGELPLEELRIFADVFHHIRQAYVEEVEDATLLEYAIQGMLAGLDPHSSYLDARSLDDLQISTSGEFGGLGLEVGMEDGFLKIIAPIDHTPASEAGLEPGDLILRIDGKPVKGLSLSEAVTALRGPSGSEVTLTLLRDQGTQPFELVLTRAVIKVTSVRGQLLEPGFGYLRIAQFQSRTGEEFVEQLQALQQKGPLQGLVLDLRNNPGGVLQASVAVTDALLDGGLVVYTQGRLEDTDTRYHAEPGDLLNGVPVVVLINGGSASASEIVAGALQDNHRAVIMGTESFGKGSVQTVLPISEDRAIKLTTARYYTPGGRSIQAQGIAPDILVERARVETMARTDQVTEADLGRHLRNGEADGETRERRPPAEASLQARDNQLYEALNLLKGLHILAQRGASRTSTRDDGDEP